MGLDLVVPARPEGTLVAEHVHLLAVVHELDVATSGDDTVAELVLDVRQSRDLLAVELELPGTSRATLAVGVLSEELPRPETLAPRGGYTTRSPCLRPARGSGLQSGRVDNDEKFGTYKRTRRRGPAC